MKKKIITFLVALPIIACHHKTQEVKTIVVDYSGKTSVFQYNRIQSISLIPLQTDDNCLIGEDPIPRIMGNNLFIRHGPANGPVTTMRIDRFTMQGVYLNQIARSGRGPGEFSGLMSDWFFYGEDMIGIHTYGRNFVLLYDFIGNFVHKVDYNLNAFNIHAQGTNFWALMPPQTDSARLIYLSENGSIIKTMMKSEKTYPASSDLWWTFHQTNDHLYIGMPYDNTIYTFEKDTVRATFTIDAGQYTIPLDFYDNPFEAFGPLMKKGIATVYNFKESKNYYVLQIVIVYEDFEDMIWGIKYKEEKEWFWSKIERWPFMESPEYPKAELTEDNKLFILIDPYALKEQLLLMNNILNPQITDTLNENDNPVLVEIRLK